MTLLLATAAINEARRRQFRNGVRSLLLEASDVNLCPRSEDLTTWTKSGGTGSATGGQGDPYGTTTAVKLDDQDGAIDVNWQSPLFAAYSGAFTTRGFSFHMKADTAAEAEIGIHDATALVYRARIRCVPVAGVLTAAGINFSVGTGRVVAVLPVTAQPGHYRVLVEVDGLTVANTHRFIVRPAGATGSAVGASILWGFMAHNLPSPTSYFPNNGASGSTTRTADTLRLPWLTAPGATTFYAKYYEVGMQRQAIVQGVTVRALQVGDIGNVDPRLIVGMSSAGFLLVQHANAATGASVSSTLNIGTLVYGDLVEVVGIIYPDGSVQVFGSINGAAVTAGPRTAAKVLPAAWAADGQLTSQVIQAFAPTGFGELLELAAAPGIFSFTEMQGVR